MVTSASIDVDLSILPDPTLPEVDFRDTSFFRSLSELSVPQLPKPSTVRQRLAERNVPHGVIVYSDLNLVVKCGNRVRVEEALTLRVMNLLLPNELPTPEVFGWRHFEGGVYIYMSLVYGSTLHSCSDFLDGSEKGAIAEQLSEIISHLRRLRQGANQSLIGSVNGGPLYDLYWRDDGGAGPFKSVKEFNDKIQEDACPYIPMKERDFEDPYRELLPDSSRVFFTHADINSHNIIIDGSPGARRVTAVVDWEQSGWYPEFWEYCKMIGIEDHEKPWLAEGWANKVMKPYEDEIIAWGEYMLWRAP